MSHLAVWGNAVLQDVQFSLRSLRKNPGYTVAAVCTLALGVGANCAIFSLIRGVLLRPLPYRNADRVVVLWERNPAQAFEQELVRPGDFADWRNTPMPTSRPLMSKKGHPSVLVSLESNTTQVRGLCTTPATVRRPTVGE